MSTDSKDGEDKDELMTEAWGSEAMDMDDTAGGALTKTEQTEKLPAPALVKQHVGQCETLLELLWDSLAAVSRRGAGAMPALASQTLWRIGQARAITAPLVDSTGEAQPAQSGAGGAAGAADTAASGANGGRGAGDLEPMRLQLLNVFVATLTHAHAHSGLDTGRAPSKPGIVNSYMQRCVSELEKVVRCAEHGLPITSVQWNARLALQVLSRALLEAVSSPEQRASLITSTTSSCGDWYRC